MKLDLSDLQGRFEDLTDRFTRFQKREGMRDARAGKEAQRDALAEAKAIIDAHGGGAQQPAAGSSSKLDLYRR